MMRIFCGNRKECIQAGCSLAWRCSPLAWQGLAWDFAPPGGESQRQVEQRMAEYLVQQVLPHARPDAPAIVVSHGEQGGSSVEPPGALEQ